MLHKAEVFGIIKKINVEEGNMSQETPQHHLHYSMLIEWSDEDKAFLVTLPEWVDRVMMPVTHGSTYAEAVQNGQEVLEMLVDNAIQDKETLPQPKTRAVA